MGPGRLFLALVDAVVGVRLPYGRSFIVLGAVFFY
jgi:hypothetical protein